MRQRDQHLAQRREQRRRQPSKCRSQASATPAGVTPMANRRTERQVDARRPSPRARRVSGARRVKPAPPSATARTAAPARRTAAAPQPPPQPSRAIIPCTPRKVSGRGRPIESSRRRPGHATTCALGRCLLHVVCQARGPRGTRATPAGGRRRRARGAGRSSTRKILDRVDGGQRPRRQAGLRHGVRVVQIGAAPAVRGHAVGPQEVAVAAVGDRVVGRGRKRTGRRAR